MHLRDSEFLILDCQTTGMRPTSSALLECAWAKGGGTPISHLLQLPEGASIPAVVEDITGIALEMLSAGISEVELLEHLESKIIPGQPVLAHYAQFERAFIEDLFTRHERPIPFEFLCTYRIARKLYPNAPSRNIRGLVGFLGFPYREIRRAEDHVKATQEIWASLVLALEAVGIEDLEALKNWLEEKPKKEKKSAPVRYEYRVDRLKRLELPPDPGVYRMLSKTGDILYVGKATSLKDRVNSYFRGKKGREKRKLELMAQVWDFQITVCGSPLEAALLESDEIKKWDPPYNVSLKTGRRALIFYRRDFSESSPEQSREFCLGPFRDRNPVGDLSRLEACVATHNFTPIFYEPCDPELYAAGFDLFAHRHWGEGPIPKVRGLLAWGLRLLESHSELGVDEALLLPQEQAFEGPEDAELPEDLLLETPEDIADRFDRVLIRAAATYLKAKGINALLNAELRFEHNSRERVLRIQGGRLGENAESKAAEFPWASLGIADFDRMGILYSEVHRGVIPIQVQRL